MTWFNFNTVFHFKLYKKSNFHIKILKKNVINLLAYNIKCSVLQLRTTVKTICWFANAIHQATIGASVMLFRVSTWPSFSKSLSQCMTKWSNRLTRVTCPLPTHRRKMPVVALKDLLCVKLGLLRRSSFGTLHSDVREEEQYRWEHIPHSGIKQSVLG